MDEEITVDSVRAAIEQALYLLQILREGQTGERKLVMDKLFRAWSVDCMLLRDIGRVKHSDHPFSGYD